jgi:hypothetical protein
MCIFIFRLARLLLAGEPIYLALSGKGVTSPTLPRCQLFPLHSTRATLGCCLHSFSFATNTLTGKKQRNIPLHISTHSSLWMKPLVQMPQRYEWSSMKKCSSVGQVLEADMNSGGRNFPRE